MTFFPVFSFNLEPSFPIVAVIWKTECEGVMLAVVNFSTTRPPRGIRAHNRNSIKRCRNGSGFDLFNRNGTIRFGVNLHFDFTATISKYTLRHKDTYGKRK